MPMLIITEKRRENGDGFSIHYERNKAITRQALRWTLRGSSSRRRRKTFSKEGNEELRD